MGRLIDAEALEKSLPVYYPSVMEAIKSAPTVDAVPAVHAHWTGRILVNGEYHFTCSHCQYGCSHGKSRIPIWKYCPNCGFSMDERDSRRD